MFVIASDFDEVTREKNRESLYITGVDNYKIILLRGKGSGCWTEIGLWEGITREGTGRSKFSFFFIKKGILEMISKYDSMRYKFSYLVNESVLSLFSPIRYSPTLLTQFFKIHTHCGPTLH